MFSKADFDTFVLDPRLQSPQPDLVLIDELRVQQLEAKEAESTPPPDDSNKKDCRYETPSFRSHTNI
jgi:hypothetical protein